MLSPKKKRKYLRTFYGWLKSKTIYKVYWGRGNFYKKIIHFFFLFITFLTAVLGISNRIIYSYTRKSEIERNYFGLNSYSDLAFQGSNIESLTVRKPGNYFQIYEHKVVEGDKLDDIANKYKVSKDTIKWANQGRVDYHKESLVIGTTLLIPELPGVLHEVKSGETLDEIIRKTSGDKFKIIEINQLEGPDFNLKVGSLILIPDGKLPPPPPLIPYQNSRRQPTNQGVNVTAGGSVNGIIVGNSLSNPSCRGYVFIRGFFPGHNGLDLSKGGGCPVRAVASGTVIFAGWSPWGEGYTVRIDHGNGVQTSYLHAETLWVTRGQFVNLGQEIMYMGTTGNSTGVHLHLTLKVNGAFVDPGQYIPF